MSDRELLELAAKAAGIRINHWVYDDLDYSPAVLEAGGTWHSLADDGDALRLAVKLEMILAVRDEGKTDASVHIEDHPHPWQSFLVEHNDDPLAATRRAITRAAAEIGRNMP